MEKPKVSVVTITYNHESYIAQALDSVLGQECGFPVEYIVSDDASTDGTQDVLRRYAREYPDRLRLLLRTENVGSQQNLASALTMCRGDYVALLDGDDYWTSPSKLQVQADFLDEHAGCALCFHDVRFVDADGLPLSSAPPPMEAERLDIRDLLKSNFIATCTVMYRWGLVPDLPAWWGETWISDYTLHVLHSDHGWIGRIPQVLAAYRVHGAGLWSVQGGGAGLRELVALLARLDGTLEFRYHDTIARSIYSYRYADAVRRLGQRSGDSGTAGASERAQAWWLVRNLRQRGEIPVREIAIVALQVLHPRLLEWLLAVKRGVRRALGDRAS